MSSNVLPSLKTAEPNYHREVGKKLDAWRGIIDRSGKDENYFRWIRHTAENSDKLPAYALDIIELYIDERRQTPN